MVVAAGPGAAEGLATFASILFSLNLLLGAFNLLPVPPLDGSTAVGLFLSERAALRFAELARTPMFSLMGLLVAWRLFDYVVRPLFSIGRATFFTWATETATSAGASRETPARLRGNPRLRKSGRVRARPAPSSPAARGRAHRARNAIPLRMVARLKPATVDATCQARSSSSKAGTT